MPKTKSKTTQDAASYILAYYSDRVRVIKMAGEGKAEASYQIKDGECNCKSFQHRKSCKHLEMASTEMEFHAQKVRLKDAREIVNAVMQLWTQKGRDIEVDEYVRDAEGLVESVQLVMAKKKLEEPNKLIGLYKGVLRFSIRVE